MTPIPAQAPASGSPRREVSAPPGTVDLSSFSSAWYDPGRGFIVRTLWYFINAVVFVSPLVPVYGLKRMLLRLFGARVGHGVAIKPRVNIKYPWRVTLGDNVWIGEGAWLDSLADIRIGANCCVSQGAMLCTGNHDWSSTSFDLIVRPIVLEQGSWVGCRATVLGGATMRSHAILTVGSILVGEAEPYTIYRGNPATAVHDRRVGDTAGPADLGYRLIYPDAGESAREAT